MDFRFLWETLKVEYLGDDLYKWSVKGVFDGEIGTLEFQSHQKTSFLKTEFENYRVYTCSGETDIPIKKSGFLEINFIPKNNELFIIKINEANK